MAFSIHPDISLGPVVLKVGNLATTARFYEEIIGLPVTGRDESKVTLGFSDLPLVVLKLEKEGIRERRSTGLFHLALLVPRREDLGSWLQRYIDSGGPGWQGASDHGVSEALYLSDPEGNGIEIAWDKPKSKWEVFPDGRIKLVTEALDLKELVAHSRPNGTQKLPDETRMGHVHLSVSDIDQARRFYIDVMGFGNKADLGSALFVAAGDYHHHVGLNVWNSLHAPAPTERSLGLNHVTLLFPNEESLEKVIARLDQKTLDRTKTANSFFVKDPAGITWNLSVRRSRQNPD